MHTSDLQVHARIDLGMGVGQLRAVPVNLGSGKRAILLVYAEDAEIDPYVRMFFFPRGTNRLRLIDTDGNTLWFRDLGPGTVPGIWFFPVFAFDLDGDGVDEIYLVGNPDPGHPLNHLDYCLETLDARTGKTLRRLPLPDPRERLDIGRTFRYFIFGGHVRGTPVLVTAQGTYGPTALQGWNPDMTRRWEFRTDGSGPQGSHMCAVADFPNPGVDGVFWGERYVEFDTGTCVYQADQGAYDGHSDIVQPVLDRNSGRWCLHTCRESSGTPRVVCFGEDGRRLWGHLERGHMDTGWAAHLAPDGRAAVFAARVGEKLRGADGEHRRDVEEFVYDAFSGDPITLPETVYTGIPVDLDGDGCHELVRGYFEGDGEVFDPVSGTRLGNVGGLVAMASKFMDHPGEQLLSYSADGIVRIWVDGNAQDTPTALARYEHRFYKANQRLTSCGYNLFNLGGI